MDSIHIPIVNAQQPVPHVYQKDRDFARSVPDFWPLLSSFAIPHLSSSVPPRLVDRNNHTCSISGQNNVQFDNSIHHTPWTWKHFPSHICLDLNSKSREIWPIWNMNNFCLCVRTLFMRGIICTLCTRRLINIYERCLTIKSSLWEGSITKKNWNASEGLF